MRIRVRDHRLLASVCRRVETWEGGWRQAARQLGIPAVTFWRLRNARGGQAINGRSFEALYDYLPPGTVSARTISRWQGDLFRAVLSPDATAVLRRYVGWLQRE